MDAAVEVGVEMCGEFGASWRTPSMNLDSRRRMNARAQETQTGDTADPAVVHDPTAWSNASGVEPVVARPAAHTTVSRIDGGPPRSAPRRDPSVLDGSVGISVDRCDAALATRCASALLGSCCRAASASVSARSTFGRSYRCDRPAPGRSSTRRLVSRRAGGERADRRINRGSAPPAEPAKEFPQCSRCTPITRW